MKEWLCYLLLSEDDVHTYIGCTNDFPRRLRQHNGRGGARYTRGHRPWRARFLVRGFASGRSALQFEWAWKHPYRTKRLEDLGKLGLRRGLAGKKRACEMLVKTFPEEPLAFEVTK